LVAAVGALLLGAARLVRGPRFIDRLTVRNPTAFIVDVSASDEHGNSTVAVAALEPHSTTVVESVIDPGDPWILDFRIAGERVGTQRVTRDELARAGWRVVIPANVIESRVRRAP
jgi:hypothetical protein